MNDSLRYPIAVSVAIGKDWRIRLPKFLSMPVPYVLVENSQPDQPWLGICGLDSLAQLRAEREILRVVAEYWTCRPTIPKMICDTHAPSGGKTIWLVAMGSWVEIWSGSIWLAEIPRLA